MPASSTSFPALCLHKASGRDVVRLNGKDIYCGEYGTPECQARYHQVIAEWIAKGRRLPARPETSDITINELAEDYQTRADGYYVKNGQPTTEPGDILRSIKPLRDLYGHSLAREFGPLQLEAVRQAFIDAGWCRNVINQRLRRVVGMFEWGVSKG